MSTRTVETEQARTMLLKYLEQHPLPMVVEINSGKARSAQQNKLQHRWLQDITEQLGENPEYWRGYCKLHFGVPIRRRESTLFAEAYDASIRPLPYELKIKMMMTPIDLPVTRDMKVTEMTEYLNEVQRHFSERGVHLTDPEELKWKQADAELQTRSGK